MSKRTVTNEKYYGLLENMSIPATLHQYNGKTYAKVGTAMPIHCATPEEKEKLSLTTHHYCDLFSEEPLAVLEELALVRLDENIAEKVFLNRHHRLLLTSSDGKLATWRCAPSFESLNHFVAGAPVVNKDGGLVSLLTARRGRYFAVSNVEVFLNRHHRLLLTSSDGKLATWRCAPSFESLNHFVAGAPVVNKDGGLVSLLTARRGRYFAVSNVEGEGGYFETSKPWEMIDMEEGKLYYGDRSFSNREELREYIAGLPGSSVTPETPPGPLLLRGKKPRIILVAENGRQISHHYLQGNIYTDIEYL